MSTTTTTTAPAPKSFDLYIVLAANNRVANTKTHKAIRLIVQADQKTGKVTIPPPMLREKKAFIVVVTKTAVSDAALTKLKAVPDVVSVSYTNPFPAKFAGTPAAAAAVTTTTTHPAAAATPAAAAAAPAPSPAPTPAATPAKSMVIPLTVDNKNNKKEEKKDKKDNNKDMKHPKKN